VRGRDASLELDHAVPLFAGGSNDESNMQVLCPTCHEAKSVSERYSAFCDPCRLQSRLNRETYALFHESQKPPQLCATMRKVDYPVSMVDVRRCRYNGFCQLVGDIPIFSALDGIVPAVQGKLADYNWVAGYCARSASPLTVLPYWGAGWYGRRTCQYMLKHGIVQWHHITHHFQATAHVTAEYLRSRLETLESCWGEHGKQALNAMFGIWGKKSRTRWHLECCTEDQDCLTTAPKTTRKAPGSDVLVDHLIKQKVLSFASWRPVHQLTLEAERLQMARAAYVIRKLARVENILSFHIDAVYFDSRSRKLHSTLESLTYKDLPGLKEHFDGFGRPSPV
jgi:hypothetical protein